jgi:hypothetical protein
VRHWNVPAIGMRADSPSSTPQAPETSTALAEHCDALFSPGSPLQEELPQWSVREGQRELAMAVAGAIADRAILMAEAVRARAKRWPISCLRCCMAGG